VITLNENINRILSLMLLEKKSEDLELDENEISEEGEETTDTTTDTKSDTGSSITPWESGVARGPGNPITSKKREDKVTRGPANTLTGKMQIRRTLGPTGKNYKA
jgi:hypothetical protein